MATEIIAGHEVQVIGMRGPDGFWEQITAPWDARFAVANAVLGISAGAAGEKTYGLPRRRGCDFASEVQIRLFSWGEAGRPETAVLRVAYRPYEVTVTRDGEGL